MSFDYRPRALPYLLPVDTNVSSGAPLCSGLPPGHAGLYQRNSFIVHKTLVGPDMNLGWDRALLND